MSKPPIELLSCVGGGPMQRLVEALRDKGEQATVAALFTPEVWRDRFAAGKWARTRARLAALLYYPLRCLVRAMMLDPAILVVTTNPFILPVFLVATKPVHEKPVVALIYDLWPDAFAPRGRASGALATLLQACNRYLMRRADAVVFIGPMMAETVIARYGRPKRFAVIETGASIAEFSSAALGQTGPRNDLELWMEGKTVLSYVGNMGNVHDVDTLAQVGRELFRHSRLDHDLAILVAGSGAGVQQLRENWRGLPADRVRFTSPLPDDKWARVLARSPVSLVTLKSEFRHTSIPSKTFSAMAAGSAVFAIAPRDSDLAQLIERHDCGLVRTPGDVVGTRDDLLDLARDPRRLAELRRRSSLAAKSYDLSVLAERWQQLLAGSIEKGGNS